MSDIVSINVVIRASGGEAISELQNFDNALKSSTRNAELLMGTLVKLTQVTDAYAVALKNATSVGNQHAAMYGAKAKAAEQYLGVVKNLGESEAAEGVKVLRSEEKTLKARVAARNKFFSDIGNAGSKMRQVGAAATVNLTLPIVAAEVFSFQQFAQFEGELTKIQTLAQASREEIAKFRPALKDMAIALGESPIKLAEGLLHISTEGYHGAEALDILDKAARMSAVGLGETKVTASALVFAMRDYKGQNLSAAEAAEVFTKVVKFGNVEIGSMVGAMGRILPLASLMKIPFQQVGGALALMTREGLNAHEAVTGLRQVFATLEHPTSQTNKALEILRGRTHDATLTAAALRKEMQTNLLGALEHIARATKGNGEAMGHVFPNIRAFIGALATLGADVKVQQEAMDEFTKKTNNLGEAFEEVAKTPGFKMQQAFEHIRKAGIDFGDAVSPIVLTFAERISKAADAFDKLTPAEKRAYGEAAAYIALVGPVFVVGSVFLNGIALAAGLFKLLAGAEATATMQAQGLITTLGKLPAVMPDFGRKKAIDDIARRWMGEPSTNENERQRAVADQNSRNPDAFARKGSFEPVVGKDSPDYAALKAGAMRAKSPQEVSTYEKIVMGQIPSGLSSDQRAEVAKILDNAARQRRIEAANQGHPLAPISPFDGEDERDRRGKAHARAIKAIGSGAPSSQRQIVDAGGAGGGMGDDTWSWQDGKKGKKGKKGAYEEWDRENDQRIQGIKDKIQSLSQAIRLYGNESDEAALKDEVLFGQFTGKAGQIEGVSKAMAMLTEAERKNIEASGNTDTAKMLALQHHLEGLKKEKEATEWRIQLGEVEEKMHDNLTEAIQKHKEDTLAWKMSLIEVEDKFKDILQAAVDAHQEARKALADFWQEREFSQSEEGANMVADTLKGKAREDKLRAIYIARQMADAKDTLGKYEGDTGGPMHKAAQDQFGKEFDQSTLLSKLKAEYDAALSLKQEYDALTMSKKQAFVTGLMDKGLDQEAAERMYQTQLAIDKLREWKDEVASLSEGAAKSFTKALQDMHGSARKFLSAIGREFAQFLKEEGFRLIEDKLKGMFTGLLGHALKRPHTDDKANPQVILTAATSRLTAATITLNSSMLGLNASVQELIATMRTSSAGTGGDSKIPAMLGAGLGRLAAGGISI